MPRDHKPYIPQGIGEIMDHLGFMTLKSPAFSDDYFPHQSVSTVFFQLNEGLRLIRLELGAERYAKLVALSDEIRSHFEADLEEKNGRARIGRRLIPQMENLLTRPS